MLLDEPHRGDAQVGVLVALAVVLDARDRLGRALGLVRVRVRVGVRVRVRVRVRLR